MDNCFSYIIAVFFAVLASIASFSYRKKSKQVEELSEELKEVAKDNEVLIAKQAKATMETVMAQSASKSALTASKAVSEAEVRKLEIIEEIDDLTNDSPSEEVVEKVVEVHEEPAPKPVPKPAPVKVTASTKLTEEEKKLAKKIFSNSSSDDSIL